MRSSRFAVCAWGVGLACSIEVVELTGSERSGVSAPTTAAPPTESESESLSIAVEADGGGRPLSGGGDSFSGLADEPEPSAAIGCRKVDFLFVVDNSQSMQDRKAALAQSFPSFIEVLEESLGINDFHIMVLDTDGQSLPDQLSPFGSNEPCEEVLGAGLRAGAQGQQCGFADERRYLSQGQPDLAEVFSCVAQVGDDGSRREHPADALLQSLRADFNAETGCNAGFLREDAILVIVIITDEDDQRSDGEPLEWHAAVLQAKGGDPLSVVTLGLLRQQTSSECGEEREDPAPRLREFVGAFERSFVGDICALDYTPFFADTVAGIDTTCDQFVPPALR